MQIMKFSEVFFSYLVSLIRYFIKLKKKKKKKFLSRYIPRSISARFYEFLLFNINPHSKNSFECSG